MTVLTLARAPRAMRIGSGRLFAWAAPERGIALRADELAPRVDSRSSLRAGICPGDASQSRAKLERQTNPLVKPCHMASMPTKKRR